MKSPSRKWCPGDLVLHEADPKTHAMLMEVLEVKGQKARTAYLSRRGRMGSCEATSRGTWHSVAALQDAALYLKTDEFAQTLRRRSRRSAGGRE